MTNGSSDDDTTNLCPTATTVEITTLESDDSSFEFTPTCDGGIADILGLEGGYLNLLQNLLTEQSLMLNLD